MLPGTAVSEHIEEPIQADVEVMNGHAKETISEPRRRLVGSESPKPDAEKTQAIQNGVPEAEVKHRDSKKDPYRNTYTRNVSLGEKFHLKVQKHSRFYKWIHSAADMNTDLSRMGKSDLAMGFHILNIENVGTVSNTFTVELMLYMVWRDEELMAITPDWPDVDLDMKSCYVPEVVIINSVGTPEKGFTRLRPHVYDDPSCPFVRLQQKMSVRCHEILEVHDFPLDLQELTMSFYFPALFARDRTREPTIYPLQVNGKHPILWKSGQRFLAEWRLRQPVLRAVTSQHIRFGRRRFKPELYLTFHVERAATYYVSNYVLILFALTTLSVTTLWVDSMDLGQRLEVNFTIVLTSCTMKFLVADQLPKVPYYTLIDYYMVSCIFFLFFLLVENTVVQSVGAKWGAEEADKADLIGMYIWLGTWLLYNLSQFVWFRMKRRKNARFFPTIASAGGHVRQTDVSGGIFYRCELGEEDILQQQPEDVSDTNSLGLDVAIASDETQRHPFNQTIG